MTRTVKFYWFASEKLWRIHGSSVEDIVSKCHSLCEKYHALHFEVQ